MSLPDNETIERDKKFIPIFLHIPKSAGQTLFQILDREYGRSNIYTFRGGRERLAESIENFKALSIAERSRYSLLRGHFAFGIHQFIDQPFTYITILREPVSRIVSHYYYVKRTPHHALHDLVKSSSMDIKRYVSSGISTELNNGQVRLISGVGSSIPFDQCGDVQLREAIRNIEMHFSVVGLTEKFDDTVLLMRRNLGWKKYPYYTKKNVKKQRQFETALTPTTVDAIREYNALDCRLYEYAVQQFEDAGKKLSAGEQRRFQQINLAYRLCGSLITNAGIWWCNLSIND